MLDPDRRRPSKRRRTDRYNGRNQSGIHTREEGSQASVLVRTLSAITEHAKFDGAIRRGDLAAGDRILVTTRNSTYSIWVLEDDRFAVTGGWFDRQGISPATLRINGCTYGQSVIRHDVVAGQGLFLEFGNNVLTTRIQQVRVLRSTEPVTCH